MEVMVKGAQDVWITGKPDASLFKTIYKRYTNFAFCDYKNYFNDYGEIKIDKKGDLLSTCFISLEDLNGKPSVPPSWSDLFDTIELYIGGQLVDSQDYTYSAIIWPLAEANNLSQSVQGINNFYPLRFFFCNTWGAALPMAAVKFHDIEIKIKNPSKSYKFVLWNRFINLDEGERRIYPSEIIITQVQRLSVTGKTDYSELIGPVKYLAAPALGPPIISNPVAVVGNFTIVNTGGPGVAWTVTGLPAGSTYTSSDQSISFNITSTSTINVIATNLYGRIGTGNFNVVVFTPFTFDNRSATGPTGPASTQSYSPAPTGWWGISGGIQYWTVPVTKQWTFTVAGAGSDPYNSTTGSGFVFTATTTLTYGTVLAILVGQKGIRSSSGCGGCGGTFVATVNATGSLAGAQPLFVAGGSGGVGHDTGSNANIDGANANNGKSGTLGPPTQSGAGGVNGQGGGTATTNSPYPFSWAGGGGGFYGNGSLSYTGSPTQPAAQAFINGGVGDTNFTAKGGFGGGGASNGYGQSTGAGGGGYSGGGAGSSGASGQGGGGGGSYSITGSFGSPNTNSGQGSVIIS